MIDVGEYETMLLLLWSHSYGWFFLSKKIECMYICKLVSLDRSKVQKGGVSYPFPRSLITL